MSFMEGFSSLAADVAAAIPVGAAELLIVMMVASGVFWFVINNLLKPIVRSIFRSMYYTFNLSNHDAVYVNFNNWLYRNSQHIHFSRVYKSGETTEGSELIPGEGSFLVNAPDCPFMLVNRSIKKEDFRGEVDELTIRIFTRDTVKLSAFYDVLKDEEMPPNLVHRSDYGSWRTFGTRKDVTTLVSAASLAVEKDLKNFLSDQTRDLYKRRGVSYRRG